MATTDTQPTSSAGTGEIRPREAPTIGRCDERAARRTLRSQIARLERAHAVVVTSSYPWLEPGPPTSALAGPRLLSLGELERVRDALAVRVGELQTAAGVQRARQAEARSELERMLADPPGHRWRQLTNADLGLPGCTSYHVLPRAGVVGMLMGWWHVKVSSGCPLASGNVAEGGRRQAAAWQAKPI